MNLDRLTPTLGEIWDAAPTWFRFAVIAVALLGGSAALGYVATAAIAFFVELG